MVRHEEIDRALRFDPLLEAERQTGVSHKDDEATTALGWMLALQNSEKKRRLMEEFDDTMFRNDLSRYIRIISEFGFKQVWSICESFEERGKQREEEAHVWFHPAYKLVLAFDTYTWLDESRTVNSGGVYYNIKPKDLDVLRKDAPNDARNAFYRATSTGGWETTEEGKQPWDDDVSLDSLFYDGNHDAREALIYNVKRLLDVATPIDWVKSPYFHVRAHWHEYGTLDQRMFEEVAADANPGDVRSKFLETTAVCWNG